MQTGKVRDIIAGAVARELADGLLRQRFELELDNLCTCLVLPKKDPAGQLLQFVQRYIEHVPDFLDAIHKACENTDSWAYVAPFLNIAEDLFLMPPPQLAAEEGLQILMDEAYLAQRLFEEVNDRHLAYVGVALLPLDMTRANIIVHHLVGDGLANQLDLLVQNTVARLLDRELLLRRATSLANAAPRAADLPCLSRNQQIDIRLGSSLGI